MDVEQMAASLSLEFGMIMEGLFGLDTHRSVILWLPNRRGVSLLHREGVDAPGTVELAVIRETLQDRNVPYNGTPWRFDYSTPITSDVRPGMNLDAIRDVMETLRELPEIDPRDMRSMRPAGEREWVAKHYGESTPACGGELRSGDICTTDLAAVRCLNCLDEVARTA